MAIVNIKNTAGDWEEMPALQGNPDDFISLVYPVGSIYMSVNDVSPSTLFGGTWEKIEDTFLLASGSTFALGQTGGEATHKLTINEMPIHKHTVKMSWAPNQSHNHSGGTYAKSFAEGANPSDGTYDSTDDRISNAGGDQPHNNMPPYLVVNIWKRIS